MPCWMVWHVMVCLRQWWWATSAGTYSPNQFASVAPSHTLSAVAAPNLSRRSSWPLRGQRLKLCRTSSLRSYFWWAHLSLGGMHQWWQLNSRGGAGGGVQCMGYWDCRVGGCRWGCQFGMGQYFAFLLLLFRYHILTLDWSLTSGQ